MKCEGGVHALDSEMQGGQSEEVAEVSDQKCCFVAFPIALVDPLLCNTATISCTMVPLCLHCFPIGLWQSPFNPLSWLAHMHESDFSCWTTSYHFSLCRLVVKTTHETKTIELECQASSRVHSTEDVNCSQK